MTTEPGRYEETLDLAREPVACGPQRHAKLRVLGGDIDLGTEPLRLTVEQYTANGLKAPPNRHGKGRNPKAQRACFPLLWGECDRVEAKVALSRPDLHTMKRDLPSNILTDVTNGVAKIYQLEYYVPCPDQPYKGHNREISDESLEVDMFLYGIMTQEIPKVQLSPNEDDALIAIGTVGGLDDKQFMWALIIPRKRNADGTYNILLIDCDLCTAMLIAFLLRCANGRILPTDAQAKVIPRRREPSVEVAAVCQSSTSAVCCALPHESSRGKPTPS